MLGRLRLSLSCGLGNKSSFTQLLLVQLAAEGVSHILGGNENAATTVTIGHIWSKFEVRYATQGFWVSVIAEIRWLVCLGAFVCVLGIIFPLPTSKNKKKKKKKNGGGSNPKARRPASRRTMERYMRDMRRRIIRRSIPFIPANLRHCNLDVLALAFSHVPKC